MMTRNVSLPLVAAICWAALLLPASLYIPIENPQNLSYQVHGQTVSRWVSLVRGNGDWILLIVAIPLVLSLVAAVLLILQARSKQRILAGAAWCLGFLILAGAFVGTVTFLVGIFVVPVGIFLIISCTNLRRDQILISPPTKSGSRQAVQQRNAA
jgi:peptidoglycan/LPS O-acetylase OafA/YrhL